MMLPGTQECRKYQKNLTLFIYARFGDFEFSRHTCHISEYAGHITQTAKDPRGAPGSHDDARPAIVLVKKWVKDGFTLAT